MYWSIVRCYNGISCCILVRNICVTGSTSKKFKRSDSTEFEDSGEDTVAYLSSDGTSSGKSTKTAKEKSSAAPDSSDWDSSDEEPLIKYTIPSKDTDSSTESSSSSSEEDDKRRKRSKKRKANANSERCSVGRPRGRAKPPSCDFSKPTSIRQHKVGRDRVDEECARLGIVYKVWWPLNPEQTCHIAVRPLDDPTEIPPEQEIPQYCILCPRNRVLPNYTFAINHYRSIHQSTLLVVDNVKMWACKCSEMRLHGSDNLARNKCYHCFVCFHPFKTSDLLGTHISTQHLDVHLAHIQHLMKKDNPHRIQY